jgi:hypothetical protein
LIAVVSPDFLVLTVLRLSYLKTCNHGKRKAVKGLMARRAKLIPTVNFMYV